MSNQFRLVINSHLRNELLYYIWIQASGLTCDCDTVSVCDYFCLGHCQIQKMHPNCSWSDTLDTLGTTCHPVIFRLVWDFRGRLFCPVFGTLFGRKKSPFLTPFRSAKPTGKLPMSPLSLITFIFISDIS